MTDQTPPPDDNPFAAPQPGAIPPPPYGNAPPPPPAPPAYGSVPPPPPVSGAIPPPPGYATPYGAPGYGQGYPPAHAQAYAGQTPRTSGKAIAVMVLGIVSIPLLCVCFTGVITAIVGLAMSPSANRDITSSGGMVGGSTQVKTGVILSIIALVLAVLLIVWAVTHPGTSRTTFTP